LEALFVFGDNQDNRENNTSQYRIFTPAKYLERQGHTIHIQAMPGRARKTAEHGIVETDDMDWGAVKETVLYERNLFPERVEKLRLMGAKRIVLTFDDHYGIIPPYLLSYDFWKRNYQRFLKALGMVDLVVVPNMRLVSEFQKYCRKIIYLPNYLDPEIFPAPKADRELIIGWGGSAAHIESWRNNHFVRALINVLNRHPDWKLRTYGVPLPAGISRHPQVEQRGWVTFAAWPHETNEFTIGLAPLNGDYDNCRSNLKLLEYNQLGIPWLASEQTPYTRPRKLAGGLLVGRNRWETALEDMVSSAEMRAELSQQGLEESYNWAMDRHTADYERILWE